MKRCFILIGMDDNPMPRFTEEVQGYICQGKIFSGGIRHHEIVKSLLPEGYEWINITVPLAAVWDCYDRCFAEGKGPVVVFVSGDPLFYGFANTLMREMPDAELLLYPSFNSLQLLAHRIHLRYDDMRIVSLTGRPWQELDRALIERTNKIGVLTDGRHTPAAIALRMLEYGYTHYTMFVGEHLGHALRQRVRRLSLEEAAGAEYETPNCLILQADAFAVRPFGLPDERFEHLDGRSRMITKMPIRLLALQALGLRARHVFWDIGFCTGSVSIEARLQFPHLQVFAFEVRTACEQLMHINSRRFGVPGIHVLIGDFLEADICHLPVPDAVFIGGHGGRLKEMLCKLKEVLAPDGCIVFNAVSAESRILFEEGVAEAGMLLAPSRHITVDDYHPITIMKACNPAGQFRPIPANTHE